MCDLRLFCIFVQQLFILCVSRSSPWYVYQNEQLFMFCLPRATRARQETRATALNAMMSDVHCWTTKTKLEGQSTVSPGYWFRELWLQKSYYNLCHAQPLRLANQWSTIVTWSSMYWFQFVIPESRITKLLTQLQVLLITKANEGKCKVIFQF